MEIQLLKGRNHPRRIQRRAAKRKISMEFRLFEFIETFMFTHFSSQDTDTPTVFESVDAPIKPMIDSTRKPEVITLFIILFKLIS